MAKQTDSDQTLSFPERLILGFTGTRVPDTILELIRHHRLLGCVLFSRNYQSPSQFRQLIDSLKRARSRPTRYPLLIAIDQEGGFVQRFPELLPWTPGAAFSASLPSRTFFDTHLHCAQSMQALGINLNFAPVVDVATPSGQSPIGIRSYGTRTEVVEKYSDLFIRAHRVANVYTCGKHFPGLGSAVHDSHFKVPQVNASLTTFTRKDLHPFRKLIHKLPFIMTSHASYQAFRNPNTLATFNRHINTDLLRTKLGYKGLLITDDLCMDSLSALPLNDRIDMAFHSGADIALVCHPDARWLDKVLTQQKKQTSPFDFINSRETIKRLKFVLQHKSAAKRAHPVAEHMFRPDQYTVPCDRRLSLATQKPVLCLYLQDIQIKRFIEDSLKPYHVFMKGLNSRLGKEHKVITKLTPGVVSKLHRYQTLVIIPRYSDAVKKILMLNGFKWDLAIFCRAYKPLPEHRDFCHNALYPLGFSEPEQEAVLNTITYE